MCVHAHLNTGCDHNPDEHQEVFVLSNFDFALDLRAAELQNSVVKDVLSVFKPKQTPKVPRFVRVLIQTVKLKILLRCLTWNNPGFLG